MKGGVGSASALTADGHVVGALVAVNALGDVYDDDTGRILAGARRPSGTGWLAEQLGGTSGAGTVRAGAQTVDPFGGAGAPGAVPGTNTTIGVVATDLPLSKAEARRLAQMAHDGLARAIRPVHTPFDGDVIFALSAARPEAHAAAPGGVGPAPVAQVGALAAQVVARAVGDAVLAASTLHGVPAVRELARGE
jgi:L-aminopeptidase/D-esterase-like protein